MVYCEVRNWYIIQENQVGYDKGGGTINYILSLKPYSFDQTIFIGLSSRHSKNIFHFLESDCYMPLTTHLTLHWKMHFPAIYSMQNFDIFCPSDATMVCIWGKLKLVKFCRIFSRCNLENLIRTLETNHEIKTNIFTCF